MKQKKIPKDKIKMPDLQAFAKKPHDQYARFVLQIRDTAIAFLQFALPEEIKREIDFDTLELSTESFVDTRLRSHISDICYVGKSSTAVRFRIVIIIEHKSFAPLRGHLTAQLTRYVSNIWQSDVQNKRSLSFTLPILLHHGVSPIGSEDIDTIFSHVPPTLRDFLPRFKYTLVDTNQLSDELIEASEGLIRNFLYTLKYSRDDDFVAKHWEKMLIFAPELRERQPGIALLLATVFYLSHTSQTFNTKFQDMQKALNIEEKRTFKTFFEVFIDENKDKWISEGMEKGMETTLFQLLSSLIQKNPTWTDEYLADLCNVEVTTVKKVRAQIQ
jgi:Putative transposase, YhgA-like